jgi:hypothetical protein
LLRNFPEILEPKVPGQAGLLVLLLDSVVRVVGNSLGKILAIKGLIEIKEAQIMAL